MKDSSRTSTKPFAYFLMIFAGMGGILYGYDLGVISGALLFVKHDISMTEMGESLIVGAVLGGGAIAILIGGILSDVFGRRRMISIASLIFISGTAIVVFANSFELLITGRLVQGIAVGIVTIVIPLYLAETAPTRIRGRSIAAFQLFLTGGILLAYIVDLLFAPTKNWRAMFACVSIPGILLFIGSLRVPESPRWLFSKKKFKKAEQALGIIHTEESASKIFEEMKLLGTETSDESKKSLSNVIKLLSERRYLIPFLISFSVACLTQLTGINCLLQYDTVILKSSGMNSDIISMLESTGVGLMNFIITFIALMLVDRIGRRPLLLIGTGGVTLSLIFCGIVSFFMGNNPLKGELLGVGMGSFILFYGLGPGIVVWLAISELLPLRIRSTGMAVCLFANSMISTLLASVFLKMEIYIGYTGIFITFAICSMAYFLLAVFVLPETKGKTLEEIEELFFIKRREENLSCK